MDAHACLTVTHTGCTCEAFTAHRSYLATYRCATMPAHLFRRRCPPVPASPPALPNETFLRRANIKSKIVALPCRVPETAAIRICVSVMRSCDMNLRCVACDAIPARAIARHIRPKRADRWRLTAGPHAAARCELVRPCRLDRPCNLTAMTPHSSLEAAMDKLRAAEAHVVIMQRRLRELQGEECRAEREKIEKEIASVVQDIEYHRDVQDIQHRRDVLSGEHPRRPQTHPPHNRNTALAVPRAPRPAHSFAKMPIHAHLGSAARSAALSGHCCAALLSLAPACALCLPTVAVSPVECTRRPRLGRCFGGQ